MGGRSTSPQDLQCCKDSDSQWNSVSPHDDAREDARKIVPDDVYSEQPQRPMSQACDSKEVGRSIIVYPGNTPRPKDAPQSPEVFNVRPPSAQPEVNDPRPPSTYLENTATLVNTSIDSDDRERLTFSVPSDIFHQDHYASEQDLNLSRTEAELLVGDNIRSEIPRQVEKAVRHNRRNRAALSYHVSRCREEIKYSSAARDYFINLVAILFQQLGIDPSNPSTDASNRLMHSARDIYTAIDRLNIAQTSLDDIAFELKKADDSLRISDERLKELVIPDDNSDHLEIFDEVFEGLSLPVEQTTVVSEELSTVVEIRLSLSQRQSLREALCTCISDPLGIIDLDQLLADQPLFSETELSAGEEQLDTSLHDPLWSGRALETELEVRLLGIQFPQIEDVSLEELLTDKDDIEATPLQWQKRRTDIMERGEVGFFEDFWQICRTSWLEFSRLLEYVDYLMESEGGHFELLNRLNLFDVDRFLRDLEGKNRVHDPAKATDHALRFTTPRRDSIRATMLPQPGLSLFSDHVSHSYRSPMYVLNLRPTANRSHLGLLVHNKVNKSRSSRQSQSIMLESMADGLGVWQQEALLEAPTDWIPSFEYVVKRRQTSSWPADRSNASQTTGRVLGSPQQLNEASSL